MLKNLAALMVLTAVCISVSFADEKQAVNGQAAQESSAKPDSRTNLEKLADPDPVVRRNAVIYLGAEKKKENFDVLTKMLDDTDIEVRRSAVNALSASGDPRAASILIEKFKTEGNTNVRINIVAALGELRSRTAVDTLKSLLKDSYPAFRNEAVRLEQGGVPEIGIRVMFSAKRAW